MSFIFFSVNLFIHKLVRWMYEWRCGKGMWGANLPRIISVYLNLAPP